MRQYEKKFKSKKGNEVIFRSPTRKDFSSIWGFACGIAAEDTFVEQLTPETIPTREKEKKWFDEVLHKLRKKEIIHIVALVNGHVAGNAEVRIGKFRHSHVGNIGLSLAREYRDEGIGTEILKTLIAESKKAGLRLLTLSCFENNKRALHVYQKLGFRIGGIIPSALSYKGAYVGEVFLYLPLVG